MDEKKNFLESNDLSLSLEESYLLYPYFKKTWLKNSELDLNYLIEFKNEYEKIVNLNSKSSIKIKNFLNEYNNINEMINSVCAYAFYRIYLLIKTNIISDDDDPKWDLIEYTFRIINKLESNNLYIPFILHLSRSLFFQSEEVIVKCNNILLFLFYDLQLITNENIEKYSYKIECYNEGVNFFKENILNSPFMNKALVIFLNSYGEDSSRLDECNKIISQIKYKFVQNSNITPKLGEILNCRYLCLTDRRKIRFLTLIDVFIVYFII
jgi:hypothetical protein